MWDRYTLNLTSWVKCPSTGMVWKFGKGMSDQASSSSSDLGSKLRGPSQNSPPVASKPDVNINKLNSDFLKFEKAIVDVMSVCLPVNTIYTYTRYTYEVWYWILTPQC
ncbi:hypothetical protein AVEN_203185-1 [Araneus ventricosus]|uniref:Uncharacterized protein n=1 Tax=Araneus ventricosus TaxID=182803 RepID=A0A4Y2CI89_ARAVE|nr:hypothetical protein AVEN_203185-1 [Araneus ventricosus]